MKKVLTLVSALSMVAGSAFASDYNWGTELPTGPALKPTTDGLNYNAASRTYSFTVSANDSVTVFAVNNSATAKGKIIFDGGAEYFVDKNSHNEIKHKVTTPGLITVQVDGDMIVTGIHVESQDYRDGKAALESAKTALNKANEKTAHFAKDTDAQGSFLDFFNAVRAQLNGQGREMEKAIIELEGYKKANTVSDNISDFKTKLGNVSGVEAEIANILTAVDNAIVQYNAIINASAKLNSTLETAKLGQPAEGSGYKQNDHQEKYINDFKSWSNSQRKWTSVTPKTSWVSSERDKVEQEMMKIKTDALAQLENFPNQYTASGMTAADFDTRYAEAIKHVENLIARAIVERDHKKHIVTELAEDIKAIEAVKSKFNIPSNYESWKAEVQTLKTRITNENDRQLRDKAALKSYLTDRCDQAQADQIDLRNNFIHQAYVTVTTEHAKVQDNLNTKSYKVAAKYENEPTTQEKFQEQFAVVQVDLTEYAKKYKDQSSDPAIRATAWEHMVVDIATRLTNLSNKNKQIDGIWTNAMGDQVTEVTNKNIADGKVFTDAIKDIRSYYDTQVTKIDGYKTAIPTKSAADAIDVNLKALFNIVLKLEDVNSRVEGEVKALNDKVAEDKANADNDGVKFDADNNIYRWNDDKKAAFHTEINGIKASIRAEVQSAIEKANEAAYTYMTTADGSDDFRTIPGMVSAITTAKTAVTYGTKDASGNELYDVMSSGAYDTFIEAYDHINKNLVLGVEYGHVQQARNRIEAAHDAGVDIEIGTHKNLADLVETIKKETLDKVPGDIADVDAKLESYKTLYATIGELKVRWSVDKAKENALQDAAKAADAGVAGDYAHSTLESVNKNVKIIFNALEKTPLDAETLAKTHKATLDEKNADLDRLENYAQYHANDLALTELTKKYNDLVAKLAAATKEIGTYKDTVKDEFLPLLDTPKTSLDAEKAQIDLYNEKHELGEQKVNISNNLTKIEEAIQKIQDDAKKANTVDETLDYNKDGAVNLKDQKAAMDDADTGIIGLDTYYDWFNKFVEYQKDSNK